MNMSIKGLVPSLIVFVISSLLIYFFKEPLAKAGMSATVVLGFNLLFLVLMIAAYFIQASTLNHSNPNVFFRAVMLGIMLKMFAVILAVITYKVFAGKDFSEKSVFISLFLYLIYLGLEVVAFTKLNKKQI